MSMLKMVLGAGFTFAISLYLAACVETKEVTLYMQDLQVGGPVKEPPVHITSEPEEGEIHISPHISISAIQSLDGRVGEHTAISGGGSFEVDTVYRSDNGIYFQDPGTKNLLPFAGRNLSWELPAAAVGIDADIGVSKTAAIFFGANYSSIGSDGLWGYHVGVGLRRQGKSAAVRLDFGWQWQELRYRAETVVTERPLSSTTSTVVFYNDRGKSNVGKVFASLTVNATHQEWLANPFVQLGITAQELADFQPTVQASQPWILPPFYLIPARQLLIVRDLRGKFSSTFVHITPGITMDLGDGLSVLTGVRVSIETTIEENSRFGTIIPIIQLDWRL